MTDNFKPTSFVKQPSAGVPASSPVAGNSQPTLPNLNTTGAGGSTNSSPKAPKKIFGMDVKNASAVAGLVLFFVLAMGGVAVSLRQRLSTGPQAPTAPASRPAADVGQIGNCSLSFDAEPQVSSSCADLTVVGNANPASSSSLTFRCQGPAGANHYFFSYRTSETAQLQLLSSGAEATSSAIAMADVNYLMVQCNPCIGTTCASAQNVNDNCTYEFRRGATPTPTPSVTPTPTPTPTPSVTPTPTPSVTPTPGVTPSPTPSTSYSCNSVCETNAQCQTSNSNFICSNGACRLASNPSSATCSTVGCNDVCSSNADCSNTSHICNGGRCRLDSYPDSTTCTPPGTPGIPSTPTQPGQPELPAELPQTGAEDFGIWLRTGVGILIGGALLLLLL